MTFGGRFVPMFACGIVVGVTTRGVTAYAQRPVEGPMRIGVVVLGSPGVKLPALSVGAEFSLRILATKSSSVHLAAHVFAPMSYVGETVGVGTGTTLVSVDAGQHASQIGAVQIELVGWPLGNSSDVFRGIVSAGMFVANQAVKTPFAKSPRNLAFSAGVGRRLSLGRVQGEAAARVWHLRNVFDESQWALSIGMVVNLLRDQSW